MTTLDENQLVEYDDKSKKVHVCYLGEKKEDFNPPSNAIRYRNEGEKDKFGTPGHRTIISYTHCKMSRKIGSQKKVQQRNKRADLWGFWKEKKVKALDLFAGIGGMSLGLIQAGIDVTWAVENDQSASSTFQINHPKTFVFRESIRKWFEKLKQKTNNGKDRFNNRCWYARVLAIVHLHMSPVSVEMNKVVYLDCFINHYKF